MEDLFQIIKKLFPDFDPGLIDELIEKAEYRIFSGGDTLLKSGQNIKSTLLVIKGSVKIFREDEEGNEFFMYYLKPGQACAVSMVCSSRHDTSQLLAKTITDTEVLKMPIELMDEWAVKYKSWYHFVLETYRARFEELLLTIDQIAFRNMDERLVFYLRRQQQNDGSNNIYIPFTEIARDLNSSREVISRLMKKLSDKGLVLLHKGHIEVIDLNLAIS